MTERNELKTAGEVASLFDEMAPRYDMLNHLFSLGQDILWRRRAARMLKPRTDGPILDGATGSADLALALARRYPTREIVGVDFSEGMLKIGRRKTASVADRVRLKVGDLMDLAFEADTFAGATCAFGIRNVVDRPKALGEFHRVLKPGGSLVFLEPALPTLPVWAPFYSWYFRTIMPIAGGFFGLRDTYAYLFESVRRFPSHGAFTKMMADAGFSDVSTTLLTVGTVALYRGVAD